MLTLLNHRNIKKHVVDWKPDQFGLKQYGFGKHLQPGNELFTVS